MVSDKFWAELNAKIPLWTLEERLDTRRVLKREIEKFAPEGKRNERVELYSELQDYPDVEGQRIDLHCEWIYWRILSHLRVSPIIKGEVYEKSRLLNEETSKYFRNLEKRIKGRKGKRKPRVEYSAEDYPSIKFDPVTLEYKITRNYKDEKGDEVEEIVESGKEVISEFEAPGIVITFDDEGNPHQRVPGYGPGVPLEGDKLEDELLSDIHEFLTKRGLQVTTVNRLLVSMCQAFLGKVIRGRAIQKRIRRYPN